MKRNIFLGFVICGFIGLTIASCNIFNWTSSTDEDAYFEGLKLYKEGKFTEAREKFAEAIKSDRLRSEYLYYHAKSLIFEADLNLIDLSLSLINANQTDPQGTEIRLPLYSQEPNMTLPEDIAFKNTLYNATWRSHEDFYPIILNKTHGEFQAEDILWEFAILSMARAVLQLRDTNNDSSISDIDWYLKVIKSGDIYTPSINATPNDFYDLTKRANFIDAITNSISYGTLGITTLANAIADSTVIDPQDIKTMTDKVNELGNNLKIIGDNVDNDNDGVKDEELLDGIDNDSDGKIDEDTHF